MVDNFVFFLRHVNCEKQKGHQSKEGVPNSEMKVIVISQFSFFSLEIVFLYFREHGGGEGQRERQRESQADSTLSLEPDVGLHHTTLRS